MAVLFWLSAILLLILIYFSQSVVSLIYERLRLIWFIDKIPGPFSIPLLGTTWQLKWEIKELSTQLREWFLFYKSKNYDLVRFWIGPVPMVSFQSADSIRTVLESHTILDKGDEYGIIERWLGKGLLISTGEKWRSRRKLLTPAFHFRMLNLFHQTHDQEARIFVDQLVPLAETGEQFDAYPFIKRCALDIICVTSMGLKVNAQTEHQHPYVKAVKRMNELSFAYSRMPWLWIKPIWYATGYGYEYDKNLKMVTDFTRKVISDRQKTFRPFDFDSDDLGSWKKSRPFLDLLLNVKEEGDLTDEDIREEVDTFMFEGHDTTSSGMAWTLWLLCHLPEHQQKVVDEIDRIFGDSDRDCTIEDLKELRYLEQCIKESLRLFPPVPFFTRKAAHDFECVGYTIPKGTALLIAPNSVQLDEKHFPNPFHFNPDNFTTEASAHRHPFAFIPFSAGPRNCIGQKFALMEEKTILSWFFRRFRLYSDIPFVKNIACPEIINKPILGVPIRLTRRH